MPKAVKRAKKNQPRHVKLADLEFPVDLINENKIGISQSVLTSFLGCPKTLLFNMNRWEQPGKEHNFFFGNLFHELLDIVYSEGFEEPPSPEFLEEQFDLYVDELKETEGLHWLKDESLEEYKAICLATAECYFEFYEEDFTDMQFIELERDFSVEWKGHKMIGKKDGKFKRRSTGKKFLFEHKTKSTIYEKTLDKILDLDFQTFYYILADEIESGERVDGTCYNVIRRWKGKRGKNESLNDMYKRLKEIIRKDPDHFFKRWEVTYNDEQHELFRFELEHKFNHLKNIVAGKVPLMRNEAFCFAGFECDFLSACCSGTMSGYRQRDKISPELDVE